MDPSLFWNAIGFHIDAETYNNEPRLSYLSCRRTFASLILEAEMSDHNPWNREVPLLEYIRQEWTEEHKDYFMGRFGQFLAPQEDNVYNYQEHILLKYLRPLTDKFYCFHCRSVVTAMVNEPHEINECRCEVCRSVVTAMVNEPHEINECRCEVCYGWVLLEMDPENLDEVPEDPIDMNDVQTRLRSAPGPGPSPQPGEDTFKNITISEENTVDDVCSICYHNFDDGQTAVVMMCNCNNFYHSHCFYTLISSWESKCPVCRQILLTDDEFDSVFYWWCLRSIN